MAVTVTMAVTVAITVTASVAVTVPPGTMSVSALPRPSVVLLGAVTGVPPGTG